MRVRVRVRVGVRVKVRVRVRLRLRLKTSASAKKVSIEPREMAALASVRPSAELSAIAGGGSGRRCQPATGGVGLLGDSSGA